MPFTPLHMGPGMALKAVAGERFSLAAFGLTQVLIDIEPLLRILRGDDVLHGPSHTWLGALAVSALALPLAAWLCPPIVALGNRLFAREGLGWLASPARMPMPALAAGVLVGAYSHVLMDAIMHSDMVPGAPWLAGNPLLGTLSIETLHLSCVGTGLLGLAAWLALKWRRQGRPPAH